MHGDEAHQSFQFQRLWLEGDYQYYPKDFHGPSLYYSTLPLVKLSTAESYEDLSKWHLRGLTVVFSLLTLALIPLFSSCDKKIILFASLFFAISPSMIFYARYYIQEPLLLCFTALFLLSLWRYYLNPSTLWAILGGTSVGLMHSSKETFIISLFSAGLAALICGRFNLKRINRTHFIYALCMALFISVMFYSSFFTHANGPWDSVKSYAAHFNRAAGGTFLEDITQGKGHTKPWHYFLNILYFHYNDTASEFFPSILHNKPFRPLSEIVILLFALMGMLFSFRKKSSPEQVSHKFLSIYTLSMLLIYSCIPYKTPWCALSFHYGFILLAGIGAAQIFEKLTSTKSKLIFSCLLALFCFDLTRQVHLQSERIAAEIHHNPFAYSHTTDDFEEVVAKRLSFFSEHHPEKFDMPIHVITRDFSPLQWYLRKFHYIGFHENNIPEFLELKTLPLVIVSADNSLVNDKLAKTHHADTWCLRLNVFMTAHIRNDLWEKYLKEQSKHAP